MPYTPTTPTTIHDLWFGTSGPRDAQVMVVAESWGTYEAQCKLPLVGPSGHLFDQMLHEAGLLRSQVFITNCFAAQPPSNEVWRFFHSKQSGEPKWHGLHPTPWAKSEATRWLS